MKSGIDGKLVLAKGHTMNELRKEVASVPSQPDSAWSSRMANAYDAFAPSMYRLAVSLTSDHSAAEDLLQEAFVRVFGRPRQIKSSRDLGAYLHRTVINLARRRWRRSKMERMFMTRPESRGESDTTGDALHEAVWQLLRQLPIRQRAAIVLHYYEDLSEAEVAERLACSPAAARSLMHRGMKKLRQEVKEGEPWTLTS